MKFKEIYIIIYIYFIIDENIIEIIKYESLD